MWRVGKVPLVQVYLSGKLENGYMLLARSGNQVQEVKTILSTTPWRVAFGGTTRVACVVEHGCDLFGFFHASFHVVAP